jgi:replicative superfamily II helicase
MLGRAGRPGYDDRGYAWVICDSSSSDRYRELLDEGKTIDSQLATESAGDGPAATDLAVHLTAEIALGTVRDIDDAMDWLETTFYYARAQRADAYVTGSELRERVSETLSWLVDAGFVEMDGLAVEPTPLGRLASEFYLRLRTARAFADLAESEELATADVLAAVATAEEFDSVSARSDEEDAVDAVLGNRGEDLDPGARKVLAILRAGMNGTTPTELRSDAWIIRQNALRLLAALRAIVDRLGDVHTANLVRRIEARVETGISEDAVGLTAIDGIGSTRAASLAAAGYTSPTDVAAASVSELVGAGLTDGVAERVHESAGELPAVAVDWGAFPERIERGKRELCEVTVRSTRGDARAALSVTVNGVEMTSKAAYLGETTLPVGVFGGSTEELEFAVRVSFPDLPLAPYVRTREVVVE